MTKLTLSVEKDVAEEAKRLAKASGTSVSSMFSRFIQSMSAGRRPKIRPGRLARKASGLVKLPPDKDYKELLAEALMEKYGMDE